MSNRRAAAGLALGVLGLIAGVTGAALGISALAMGAGMCAGAAGLAVTMVGRTDHRTATTSPDMADRARMRTRIAELENEVASLHRTGANERSASPDVLVGPKGRSSSAGSSFDPDARPTDALTDPETGLFSEGYFRVALDARVASARRRLRPVSVVLIDVVANLGQPNECPGDPQAITDAIKSTLREADTASRLGDGRFALVLEDTPEPGAIWTIERLRGELLDGHPEHTVWAGVSCYPAHAFETREVLDQAARALAAAREWHQNRIEIATTD